MLQNTFIHVPKVSTNAEIGLWTNKINTWQDFLDAKTIKNFSSTKKELINSHLQESIDAFKRKNYSHFLTLKSNQHWRMYDSLKDDVCFLDIETTGLSKHHDEITLIGIHSNDGTKIFMNGKNLDKFNQELKKYSMIITFNGRCFDVPFIKSKFTDTNLDNLYHADLRFILADLGFRGGLKSIEVQKGITRSEELDGVDGFEAVRLWHRYQRGDNSALETLKAYLTADVENLRLLMDEAFIDMKKKHFLAKITR